MRRIENFRSLYISIIINIKIYKERLKIQRKRDFDLNLSQNIANNDDLT